MAEAGSSDMFSRYSIDQNNRFGRGGYGITFAANDVKTGEELVVKVIDMRKQRPESIAAECQFLETVRGNEHVIQIRAHGRGQGKHSHLYFIFMERASGGELFDQLTTYNGSVPEDVSRDYMAQMVDGIAHCHAKGVAHRDIKLENVLLNDKKVVKVIDFGLAHQYAFDPSTGAVRRTMITGLCGSKSYAAPEVWSNSGYDGFQADMWSLGVSLFGLLNGFFPVDEAKSSDWRFEKLRVAQLRGHSSVHTILGWYKKRSHLSPKAVDLLDALLAVDPNKRPSIQDVLAHPWITGKEAAPIYDDMTDALHYRGAGVQQYGTAEDMEILDDGPVYRSMNVAFVDEPSADEELGPPPGLARQAAFGGSEQLDDLFLP